MILRRAALLLLALPLAACAAAAPPPATPSASAAPAEAMPSRFVLDGAKGVNEVDGEMIVIAKAEEEIDRLFPNADKSKASAPSKKAAPADQPAKEDAQGLSGGAAGACATACKALASMQSSADHLCKLAGEADGRCEDARGRVRGASARVHRVCPACSAGAK